MRVYNACIPGSTDMPIWASTISLPTLHDDTAQMPGRQAGREACREACRQLRTHARTHACTPADAHACQHILLGALHRLLHPLAKPDGSRLQSLQVPSECVLVCGRTAVCTACQLTFASSGSRWSAGSPRTTRAPARPPHRAARSSAGCAL